MNKNSHERFEIMKNVQKYYLTEPNGDESKSFTAADVAILPPGLGYKQRSAALEQSRSLLRQMTGCVRPLPKNRGVQHFIHAVTPLREGLTVCKTCVFHTGSSKGQIPLLCPDNMLARAVKARITPSISDIPDTLLQQLPLFQTPQ